MKNRYLNEIRSQTKSKSTLNSAQGKPETEVRMRAFFVYLLLLSKFKITEDVLSKKNLIY